jgi:hypothetical protein
MLVLLGQAVANRPAAGPIGGGSLEVVALLLRARRVHEHHAEAGGSVAGERIEDRCLDRHEACALQPASHSVDGPIG